MEKLLVAIAHRTNPNRNRVRSVAGAARRHILIVMDTALTPAMSNGMGTRSNAGEEKRMYWEFWLISAVYAASVINVLFLVLG
ncbi:MAG: hypothetical protein R3E21_06710 [Caenibius sp.]